jgi:hypothetical protein
MRVTLQLVSCVRCQEARRQRGPSAAVLWHCLRMDYHLSAVVKGDVKVPGEITANYCFRAKHTDDSRILSPLSQIRDFYFAKVGWSKDARCLISEFIP